MWVSLKIYTFGNNNNNINQWNKHIQQSQKESSDLVIMCLCAKSKE